MPRLPRPGRDIDNWGDLLNSFLLTSLDEGGKLKENSVSEKSLAPGAVTPEHLSNDLQSQIESANQGSRVWNSADEPKDAKDGDLWVNNSNPNQSLLQTKTGNSWLALGALVPAGMASPMAVPMAVHDPNANILLGKKFTSNVADSTTETGNPIANMTDNNENTRWISQPTSPMNATVDMVDTYNLDKVTIVWAGDTVKNYQVQMSNNNSAWTTIASGVTNNTTKQTVNITSFSATATGRYLRIVGTDRWNNSYGNSIWEVRAYGMPVGQVNPPTTAPTNLVATPATTTVGLAWSAPTTINGTMQGYNVYNGSTKLTSSPVSGTSYTATGLASATTYTFSVKAVTSTGEGPAVSVSTTTKAVTVATNILLGKKFTSNVADSTTETGNPIANMTDNNENTRWISQPTSPMNATVDMVDTYNLDKVTIVWAGDTVKNYQVQMSNNNSAWTTIASGVTNNTTKQTVNITSFSATATGRYLRIVGTDRWNNSYGNSIWEVMAYGSKTTAPPVPTGSISSFKSVVASTSAINLSWGYSGSAISNFTLKRNGATIATLASATRSYSSTGLSAGTAYTYTLVGNFVDGGTTAVVTTSATTNPGSNTGSKWASGSSGEGTLSGAFASWRGESATYNRVWCDADEENQLNMWGVQDFKNAGYRGVLDVAPGGFIPGKGWTWRNAAGGSYDSHWRKMAQRLNTIYTSGTFERLDISLFHELNGDWYAWSVHNGEQGDFRTAFARMSNIFRQELSGKNIRIVLSLNSDNNCNIPIAELIPASSSFDILGVDLYDFEMANTEAKWSSFTNSWSKNAPLGLNAWIDYSASISKPISFPEWGVNPDNEYSGSPRDNPLYIQKMYDAFKSIAPADKYGLFAGKLAGEAYYNDRPNKSQLYPTTSAPNSANKYKALVWGG